MDHRSEMSDHERNHLPILCRLSDDDIDHIWSSVSCFIGKQMFLRKGVCVFGLGTFTFCQQKLNLGNKHVLTQKPVFILSEKLCQYHGLKQTKPPAADVPVVPLNFSALSAEGPFDRETVEGCVRETLLLLLRAASASQPVRHSFPGIGCLSFRQSRVKMMFCRDFLSDLVHAQTLSAALTNRQETRRETPAPERPTETPASETPASERPASERPTETPASETPASETPASETPASERPTETPASETPASETPASERPASERPAPERPASVTLPSIAAAERPRNRRRAEPSATCHTDPHEEPGTRPDRRTETDLTDGSDRDEDDPGPAAQTQTCADHRRAGQELCYVCMQREQRSVPVYWAEERWRAEREQDRLIVLHQHQKDLQYFQNEETDRQKRRADAQTAAAFNLSVAEAQRRRRASACSQSHGSYIFASRASTADRVTEQRRFMQELMQEAGRRRRTQAQAQQEQRRLDALHLLQLSEEMALRRSQQFREKHQMAKAYREALEQQNKRRCAETALHTPGSDAQPVFGLMDASPATVAEGRRRAQIIAEELKNTADSRRRDKLKKCLNEQEREREAMQRDQKKMLEERICRYEKLRRLQAACEESWRHNLNMKHQREQEELNIRRSGGETLTEQLGKYERCGRCKRDASDCGQSNIFRDMNYMSGSRLML